MSLTKSSASSSSLRMTGQDLVVVLESENLIGDRDWLAERLRPAPLREARGFRRRSEPIRRYIDPTVLQSCATVMGLLPLAEPDVPVVPPDVVPVAVLAVVSLEVAPPVELPVVVSVD
jgi:hypothetical protein